MDNSNDKKMKKSSNIKILILILSSNTYPSSRNKKAIKKTWASDHSDNFRIIFYESGKDEKIVDLSVIFSTSLETIF